MTAQPKKSIFRPKIEIIRVPWGETVELKGPEVGTWTICNIGLLSHMDLTGDEHGNLVVQSTAQDPEATITVPVLSLLHRRPFSPRGGSTPWGDGGAILMAMTSSFPVRMPCTKTGIVVLRHQTEVRRDGIGGEAISLSSEHAWPKPLYIELAGCLRLEETA